ncbi:MAG TPA: lysophospholipid acyltransferase family protein [Candidatus Tectomicrobia bacterium]|nr:lysophospholipid acyltransferase family protein [Candidatus Tectomicrobia bacterium]
MTPVEDDRQVRQVFAGGAQSVAVPGFKAVMSCGKRVWFRLSWLALGTFLAGLNRLKITGVEHVPAGGGVLLAANHVSIFDTLLVPWVNIAKVRVEVVWAPAKAELFDIPIINRIIASWGAFPVQRGGRDIGAMRRLVELMRCEKVMLFPEGTRSADGQLGKGNRAVGKLIYLARPIVIPTAILGTERLLAKGGIVPRLFSTLEVRFGPPLDLARHYAAPGTKATAEAITSDLMRSIARLRGEEAMWVKRFLA